MSSFQAKMGREWPRNSEKKNIVLISSCQKGSGEAEKERKKKLSFWSDPTRPGIDNSKKIAKKFKNWKTSLWLLFMPKRDRTRWEREKKKLFRSVTTQLGIENSKKNCKRIQKIEKHHYVFISSQNGSREVEKEWKIKNVVPISSYPTWNRELKKNSKKIKKIKKTLLWLHFKLKQVKRGREREKKKIIVPISSYPTRNREF